MVTIWERCQHEFCRIRVLRVTDMSTVEPHSIVSPEEVLVSQFTDKLNMRLLPKKMM